MWIIPIDPDCAPSLTLNTSTVQTKGACSSETSGLAYRTTRRHKPEDQNLNITSELQNTEI
jgi:hypothetical protein